MPAFGAAVVAVEGGTDVTHQGPATVGHGDAPAVDRDQPVVHERRQPVDRGEEIGRVDVPAAAGFADIDLVLAHQVADDVAPQPVVGADGNAAGGGEPPCRDGRHVLRDIRDVLRIARGQAGDRRGADARDPGRIRRPRSPGSSAAGGRRSRRAPACRPPWRSDRARPAHSRRRPGARRPAPPLPHEAAQPAASRRRSASGAASSTARGRSRRPRSGRARAPGPGRACATGSERLARQAIDQVDVERRNPRTRAAAAGPRPSPRSSAAG